MIEALIPAMFAIGATIKITTLILILGALGGVGGMVTLYLAPRQGRKIAIEASAAAVHAVSEAMDRLERQLEQAYTDLAAAQTELKRLRADLEDAKSKRAALLRRIDDLQARISSLEDALSQARRAVDRGELPPPYGGPERRTPGHAPGRRPRES